MKFYNWLNESKENVVCVYSGRFQPFHYNHYLVYKDLVKKFGKENVFIGTSDKTELPKSPFSFKEKLEIITTIFQDVPKNKVVQVKNPYSPKEILSKFDNEKYSLVVAVGGKDADRLSKGKYYDMYDDKSEIDGFKDKGYVWVIPNKEFKYNGEMVSGTTTRSIFKDAPEKEKKNFFKTLYGKWNEKIYNLINRKINNEI